MQIEVIGIHLDVTASLEAYIQKRIDLALDRFTDRIEDVTIRLTDISGAHGPGTKRCHMTVHLQHREVAIVEQDHTDIYTAVDKASNRLKRTVRRHINRVRDARRSDQRTSIRAAWA